MDLPIPPAFCAPYDTARLYLLSRRRLTLYNYPHHRRTGSPSWRLHVVSAAISRRHTPWSLRKCLRQSQGTGCARSTANAGLSGTSKPGRAINGTRSQHLTTLGSPSSAAVLAASGWKFPTNADRSFILEVRTGNGTGPGVYPGGRGTWRTRWHKRFWISTACI